ncbi:MAG: DUF922 domain-containing protein [Notoacmeibacter sp.]|nr:DUF922 domain-containing protein [Notoacmeibacter sp.]
MFRFAGTVAMSALVCFPLQAADVRTVVRHYTVRGATMQEIERDFERRGPRVDSAGGMRHPGATRMEFLSKVDYRQEGGRCRVTGVNITLKATVTAPRWAGNRRASAELQRLWPLLSADIRRHEQDHVRIAADHARLLESRIANVSALGDCGRAEDAVNRATAAVMQAHDRAQAAFDRAESRGFQQRMQRLIREAGAS